MSQTSKPQAGDRVRVVPVAIRMPTENRAAGVSAEAPAVIRDPLTGATVPADGIVTKFSPFWARRVAEGAVLIEPAAPPKISTTLEPAVA